jgi:hypothetical protein
MKKKFHMKQFHMRKKLDLQLATHCSFFNLQLTNIERSQVIPHAADKLHN